MSGGLVFLEVSVKVIKMVLLLLEKIVERPCAVWVLLAAKAFVWSLAFLALSLAVLALSLAVLARSLR